MPHICLFHSQDVGHMIAPLLLRLSRTLEAEGVNVEGIKCYGLPLHEVCSAGQLGASMVHLNLRVLRKPDRNAECIKKWLRGLNDVLNDDLPDNCVITAEANFLPDIYISATA